MRYDRLLQFFRNRRRADEQRQPSESASVPIILSRVRFASARYVLAIALWYRRRRTNGDCMDRSTLRGETKLVASVASGSDRLWQLSLSSLVVLCRKRPPHQSGLAYRGWLVR